MTIPPWFMALASRVAESRWHGAESIALIALWPIAYLVAMASGYRIALGARPWSMGRFLLIGAVVWIDWATATAALSSDPKGFLIVWFVVMIIGVVPLPFLFVVKGIVDRD